jgi:hypothetical protein
MQVFNNTLNINLHIAIITKSKNIHNQAHSFIMKNNPVLPVIYFLDTGTVKYEPFGKQETVRQV